MDRREDLERWIAGTRRTQQRLKRAIPIAAVIALALCFVNRLAGGFAIATVGLVALSGFWITGGHIADWEDKLYKLDHPEKPATSGKRRYQAD